MGKKSILLAGKDKAVRGKLRNAFKKRYEVLEASVCEELTDKITKSIDLAIVDFMIPYTEGFRTFNFLKIIKPELPVIIITDYSCEKLAIWAIRYRAFDYIKMPVELRYLKKRISKVLDSNK